MRYACFVALLLSCALLSALTGDDARFCVQHERWDILAAHGDALAAYRASNPDLYYQAVRGVALWQADTLAWSQSYFDEAIQRHSLTAARTWVELTPMRDSLHVLQLRALAFTSPADRACLNYLLGPQDPALRDTLLRRYGEANELLAEWLKEKMDDIAVERSDSLRLARIDAMEALAPAGSWSPGLLYLRMRSLTGMRRWAELNDLLVKSLAAKPGIEKSYYMAASLLNADLRDSLAAFYGGADVLLEQTDVLLQRLRQMTQEATRDTFLLMYDTCTRAEMLDKTNVMQARLMLAQMQQPTTDDRKRERLRHDALSLLGAVNPTDNDAGEVAELWYWSGMANMDAPAPEQRREAATAFVRCLVAGAPRKHYDDPAWEHVIQLAADLAPDRVPMDWARELVGYTGPAFTDANEQAGVSGREGRAAWADMDADGDPDLLLNGGRILRNDHGRFTDVTATVGFAPQGPSGGLWADVNRDGRMDVISLSHRSEGGGDGVWLQGVDGRFAPAAFCIDDSLPTEGAAVFDLAADGYPELYCASYESPGGFEGNQDRLYLNNEGTYAPIDRTHALRNPWDMPGAAQAGRGVAPADYDNDGWTELLVCNYRLDRNFLLKPFGTISEVNGRPRFLFMWLEDIAAREALQGHDVDGYYGHSIGADWGDYDNDGALALVLANLAHPRYITFSDVSMLLRNDGPALREIDGATVEYTAFTDVTREAGITYDELHSDPSWLDVDNDGDLDLFITSIYENERTYLYLNNGDGAFTDITWLAGCRVYNGWGNAVADYDADGRPDILVASGSGVHLLRNVSRQTGHAVRLRPVRLATGSYALLPADEPHQQTTPLLGARVELQSITPGGELKTRIRELQGGKGTTSQHEDVAHFGIGDERPLRARCLLGNVPVAEWTP